MGQAGWDLTGPTPLVVAGAALVGNGAAAPGGEERPGDNRVVGQLTGRATGLQRPVSVLYFQVNPFIERLKCIFGYGRSRTDNGFLGG
jgi:hypothetical protein